jgi:hypothetical protein
VEINGTDNHNADRQDLELICCLLERAWVRTFDGGLCKSLVRNYTISRAIVGVIKMKMSDFLSFSQWS